MIDDPEREKHVNGQPCRRDRLDDAHLDLEDRTETRTQDQLIALANGPGVGRSATQLASAPPCNRDRIANEPPDTLGGRCENVGGAGGDRERGRILREKTRNEALPLAALFVPKRQSTWPKRWNMTDERPRSITRASLLVREIRSCPRNRGPSRRRSKGG